MKKYLAIDIGKTSLKYAVINEELDFSDKGKEYISTVDSKDELFDAIRDVADQFRGEVEGVTITMPGVIDTKKGFAYSGGVYPWARNIPYAQMLSDHIGMILIIPSAETNYMSVPVTDIRLLVVTPYVDTLGNLEISMKDNETIMVWD